LVGEAVVNVLPVSAGLDDCTDILMRKWIEKLLLLHGMIEKEAYARSSTKDPSALTHAWDLNK